MKNLKIKIIKIIVYDCKYVKCYVYVIDGKWVLGRFDSFFVVVYVVGLLCYFLVLFSLVYFWWYFFLFVRIFIFFYLIFVVLIEGFWGVVFGFWKFWSCRKVLNI